VKDGVRGIALLFVVGEERNSAGAYAASRSHNRYSISLAHCCNNCLTSFWQI